MFTNASARDGWASLLLCSALVLGACGSGELSASDDETSPSALALDEATSVAGANDGVDARDDDARDDDARDDDAVDDDAMAAEPSAFDIDEFSSLADLEGVELTPEIFEALKENEVSRTAILEEMNAQGLGSDAAECFLDEVSPGLFIAFGVGEQPTDEQFAELLTLLETCEIAFSAAS